MPACPWCAEDIDEGSERCPYCGERANCPRHPHEAVRGTCRSCETPGCARCLGRGDLCRRCRPAKEEKGEVEPAEQYELGRILQWLFEDPEWVQKVVYGALCLLGGCLVLPALMLQGYKIRVARQQWRRPGALPLPGWDDAGSLMWTGLTWTVAILLPGLLLVAVFLAVVGGSIAVDAGLDLGGGLAAAGMLGGYVLMLPLSLALWVALPAIELEYLVSGGSALAGLRVRRLWGHMREGGTDYVMLFLYYFVIGLIGQAGAFAFYIGLFFTVPWATFSQGCLFGRYLALRDERAREAGGDEDADPGYAEA